MKRTGLRSSLEDFAHYRRFHGHALDTLRKGVPRREPLQELTGNGVSDKTAERIVVSAEQELAVKSVSPGLSRGQRWGIIAFSALFFGAIGASVMWQMSQDRTLSLKYAAPGLLFFVVASAGLANRILLRARGSLRNPPPR